MAEVKCSYCGQKYVTDSKIQKYCSLACRSAYFNERRRENKAIKKVRYESSNINKNIIEAKKAGLTYGQYMAQKTVVKVDLEGVDNV